MNFIKSFPFMISKKRVVYSKGVPCIVYYKKGDRDGIVV